MDQPTFRPDAPSITRASAVPPLPGRRPDPGSRMGAWIGGTLALVFILLVAFLQQTAGSAAASQTTGASDVPPPSVLFEVIARIYVKLGGAAAKGPDAGAAKKALADAVIPELETMADGPADKVRVAIVAAEFGQAEDAVRRLTEVADSLAADSPLVADARALLELYGALPESPSPLDAEEEAGLAARHGWFGELAAVYAAPAGDAARQAVAGGGEALVVVLLAIGLVAVLAILSGFVLLIVGIVMASKGRLKARFVPPAPGGSVAIETVAVFVGGFLLMKTAMELVAPSLGDEHTVLVVTLATQWALVLTLLWPVVRGVRAREGLALFGLHRGEGVLKEIGCGIVGYLACLPFLVLGAIITLALVAIQAMVNQAQGQPPPATPESTVIDLVGRQGSPGVIVLLFLLASLWAPLVEETIFRGALYRHLRSRWHWLAAALVVALGFGAMHGYALPLLFPVMGLGFGFALLREWRGSIIACMTAHCIHNAAVLTVMLVTVRLLGM